MSSETYKIWPFAVLPVDQRTKFHSHLITLLEWAHESGHSPCVSQAENEICLGSEATRHASFVLRSSRNRYWEPWLCDHGMDVRLGPLFGFSDEECIVFDGIADVATFSMRWLEGSTLEDALAGLSVFNRMDTNTALRINS